MTKLNQILAIEKGVKTRTYGAITDIDKALAKQALVTGITRVYDKKDDDGEQLPPESTLVQVRVSDALRTITAQLTRQWDVTATKEWANRQASADIKLADGTVVATGVPVTYLLFLEKQLNDLHTLVGRLPILDPQYEWTWDANSNCYRTGAQQTHRTKKLTKVLVLYPATVEHPAQTQTMQEDEIVGFWNTTHLSGAIPAQDRQGMVERVEELKNAVKVAREAANDMTVDDQTVAESILTYVFPKVSP